MDINFQNFSKLIASFENKDISALLNNCEVKNFNEVSLFNSDNTFNKDLLTKEGFVNSLFDAANENDEKTITKEQLEQLYDNIAGMDGDEKMSENELKFFAELGEDENKKGILDKSDFVAITVKKEPVVQNDNSEEEFDNIKSLKLKQNDSSSESAQGQSQRPVTQAEIAAREMKYESLEEHGHPKVSEKNVTSVNDELEVDGIIKGPIIQGRGTGDCWLLAGLNALNSTEKGQQIIRNSIIPNEDGTVTVNFAGANKSYTLTPDEIKAHDTDLNLHDKYSNGDNDVLVLELGIEKLIKDNPELLNTSDGIKGGSMDNLWKALTPNYQIETYDDNKNGKGIPEDKIRETLQKALNNKNVAIGFGLRDGGTAKLTNGKDFEYNTNAHVLAVTNVNDNEVTFVNSTNGASYNMTWEEFIKLQPAGLFSVDLTNA